MIWGKVLPGKQFQKQNHVLQEDVNQLQKFPDFLEISIERNAIASATINLMRPLATKIGEVAART